MNVEQKIEELEARIEKLQKTRDDLEINLNKANDLIDRYGELIDKAMASQADHEQRVFTNMRSFKEQLDDMQRRTYDCYYHLFPQMIDVDIALSDASKAAGKDKKDPA